MLRQAGPALPGPRNIMRALYFDCFAGVSGDMIIGALIDLGVDAEHLEQQLASLHLSGYQIDANTVTRASIAATKFDVRVEPGQQTERRIGDIRKIIEGSDLSDDVKSGSLSVFERLAQAEAAVHNKPIEEVHFHEVGAVDSIVDIVGAMIGFEALAVERFIASPLRLGFGSVKAEHGTLPVPAPGTAELLRGVPIYAGDMEGEFVTPTGAAIVTAFCSFGPLPEMTVERVGYGAGSRDPEGFPNVLRLILGEMPGTAGFQPASTTATDIVVIETNIDDMNPQAYGFVFERAFELGALDVFTTPVQMKKDRPGVLLTVLCEPRKLDSLTEMLLRETTTLGVRYYEAKRRVLERSIETVETEFGPVRVKVAYDGGRRLHFQAEYEDCARLARQHAVPFLEVQSAAGSAYLAAVPAGKEGEGG
jgi:uncharacterized protein (TIGR00299 family) protein